ncbi:hypothetical protein [Aneurinibacillus sp. REN35]|uniref:hypothetical protein n=1 Tax=Aneurinibacillus sp. REN35 TaxID=3237286 RepID=UPI00352893D0
MLDTPLGRIRLVVNEKEIEYTAIKLDGIETLCPDVNGRFSIQYEYKKEFKGQTIKCFIPSLDVKGDFESGERLEAISFYQDDIKLTIGAEGEFYDPIYQYLGYDYNGDYLSNGIEYETYETTEDRIFSFGVCWIQPYTTENDIQTWFGADPTLMP